MHFSPASNEEMANQDHHLHLCDTENTSSVLVNNLNISLFLFIACVWTQNPSAALTLNTIEPLSVMAAWTRVVSTRAAFLFHH